MKLELLQTSITMEQEKKELEIRLYKLALTASGMKSVVSLSLHGAVEPFPKAFVPTNSSDLGIRIERRERQDSKAP